MSVKITCDRCGDEIWLNKPERSISEGTVFKEFTRISVMSSIGRLLQKGGNHFSEIAEIWLCKDCGEYRSIWDAIVSTDKS